MVQGQVSGCISLTLRQLLEQSAFEIPSPTHKLHLTLSVVSPRPLPPLPALPHPMPPQLDRNLTDFLALPEVHYRFIHNFYYPGLFLEFLEEIFLCKNLPASVAILVIATLGLYWANLCVLGMLGAWLWMQKGIIVRIV